PDGGRSSTVTVALPEAELTADFLDRTRLRTEAGAYIPLSEIVTVADREGFSTVRRENGLRVVTVTGDISEDDPVRAEAVTAALRDTILPQIEGRYGVSSVLGGLAEQERDFLSDALLGFMLCLLGIYLTLTWIFGSWSRPVVVMAIIPFGLVGTIWGHYVWDVPLSMFSVVGMIGMTGIIINDSIVLITTIDEYAEERGIIPAVVDAVADRLRPVLLTTLTTVLGLAPLLYESSQQAQFLKPTVITLVYGLGFGMVLVLLIVPAIIAIQTDIGQTRRSWRRMLRAPARGPRVVMALATLATALLLAATVGIYAVTGAPWAPLASAADGLGISRESAAMPLLTLIAGLIAIVALAAATAPFTRRASHL
ncbi:MAG: efflux RND transporter permease subunit, partial [Pseudomonadota bacterium]